LIQSHNHNLSVLSPPRSCHGKAQDPPPLPFDSLFWISTVCHFCLADRNVDLTTNDGHITKEVQPSYSRTGARILRFVSSDSEVFGHPNSSCGLTLSCVSNRHCHLPLPCSHAVHYRRSPFIVCQFSGNVVFRTVVVQLVDRLQTNAVSDRRDCARSDSSVRKCALRVDRESLATLERQHEE
jgi:hypothetical protein